MIRTISSLAVAIAFGSLAVANDPCPTCGNGVKTPGPSKPACDNKIYPLSEMHYIKRYCGPVISPNATYGYFQTQWRAWDGQQVAGCANPAVSAPVQPVVELPKVEEKPIETKPAEATPRPMTQPMNPMPMAPVVPMVPGKEEAPKPLIKPKKKETTSLLTPAGQLPQAEPVSPGVYLLPTVK